jgi:6-phosphogluconolactonase (cycloisomerase 2 family)
MATQIISPRLSPPLSRRYTFPRSHGEVLPVVLLVAILTAPLSSAQTPQQQYAYTSSPSVTVLSKNAQTGVLTPLTGAPFNVPLGTGPMAIDALGRFLFILSPTASTISMFQIDSNSGALTQVPASPFTLGPTLTQTSSPTNPQSLATEKSGQFLYVGYKNGSIQGMGELDEFTIDATHLQLVPATSTTAANFLSTTTGPVALGADPKGRTLYAYLGFVTTAGFANAELDAYSIDPVSGNLTFLNKVSDGAQARCMAIDPQDRFLYTGHGDLEGQFDGFQISPVNGSLSALTPIYSLPSNLFPEWMVVETSAQFLYFGTTLDTHIFSINPTTGALTEVPSSPLTGVVSSIAVADPMGPFLYTSEGGGNVHGFQINLQTGFLTELPGSPFSAGGPNLVISGTPVQAVSGPAVALFPDSVSFGNVLENTPSTTQIVQIVSNGGQALSVSAIGFSGANPGDFSQTNTCNLPAVLNPNTSCSVSITFTPAAAGARQATLTVTDNAPGSPQSAALTGTGITPASAITFMPSSLTFASFTQGVTSPPQSITLTSSGNAPLNISSIALGGANPTDFAQTNTCQSPAALNPGSTCSVSITFTPTAAGTRQAMLLVSDNAPGTPQSAALSGTGLTSTSGVTLTPNSLSFPATTQGTSSSSQTITLTNSGNVTLNISSIALGGTNSTEFTMTSSGCTKLAVNATCAINTVFSPLATGAHSATITITDDAPNSPQIINVSGNANAAFMIAAAPSGSLSATVTAGQTAQYNLQITPGANYSGTISLACTGAPTGASCQLSPSMVSVSNGTAAPFTVMVPTSGAAGMLPFSNEPGVRSLPTRQWPFLPLFLLVLILFAVYGAKRASALPARPLVFGSTALLLASFAVFAAAGCGGGSSISSSTANTPAPPPVVTPKGTSMLTITPSATSISGQPLQLPTIQLTLTVN